ncbi:MAG: ammonium transporter [Planctomycetes bacterium]|nr:ammonium transporter [Planctomycetota bacterium]
MAQVYAEDEAVAAPAAEEAAPAAEEAVDEDSLAAKLGGLGIELSTEEATAVAAFDAAGTGDDFAWPEVGEGGDAHGINADIIGKIKDSQKGGTFWADNLWLMICAALVFIMHLGFATLESGLCQAKNTTNILFKNVMIVCIGLLTYAIIGFNMMYPGFTDDEAGIIKVAALGMDLGDWLNNPLTYLSNMTSEYAGYTWWTDWLFQGMFAATAATIISGCVAERIKLGPFLIFAALYVGILYPIVGSWHWGGGFLSRMGFYDFAGSTLVHSVGGWGGLAAILVIGSRSGKYGPDGGVRPLVGHNMPLATIGVFLLWLGWFGFNGGSVLAADPDLVSYTLVTTCLAAAAGGFVAGLTSWAMTKKPDLTMALNGVLAGLVGITASADCQTLMMATIIGVVCGVVVYFAVITFDKLRIDDPVGALSVHLVCGILGTLFVAAVPGNSLWVQFIGIAAYGAASFGFALVVCLALKAIVGLRVSEEEELEGLDICEHGQTAYHALEAR